MKVYFDFNDWWIGYYRGPNHHYVCPIPTVVLRWKRRVLPPASTTPPWIDERNRRRQP